jgi:acetylglutamate kinase
MSETVVIKYGGNAMSGESGLRHFAESVAALIDTGVQVVVVHGGGPQINQGLAQAGIESEFRHGLRVTSPAAMQVVRAVLVSEVQRDVVNALVSAGVNAIGVAGDEGLLMAQKHQPIVDGVAVDLGLVGRVTRVNLKPLADLLAAGYTPVVTGVAKDELGQCYNVNADVAAGAVAGALQADRYVVLTDVDGVYRSWPDKQSLIEQLTLTEAQALLSKLDAGMLPKMQGCLDALVNGAGETQIINADIDQARFVSAAKGTRVGTLITK